MVMRSEMLFNPTIIIVSILIAVVFYCQKPQNLSTEGLRFLSTKGVKNMKIKNGILYKCISILLTVALLSSGIVSAEVEEELLAEGEVFLTTEGVSTDTLNAVWVTSNSVHLEWENTYESDSFSLYRDGELVYSGGNRSYEDGGLSPNTEYNYVLEYIKMGSVVQVESLSVRTNKTSIELMVTSKTSTSITLAWTPTENTETYSLFRGNQLIYQGTNLSFTDTDLASGGHHKYTVISNDSSPELLINGGMEEYFDNAGIADGWFEYSIGGATGVFSKSTSDKYRGSYAQSVKADYLGATGEFGLYQDVKVKPNKKYFFTVRFKGLMGNHSQGMVNIEYYNKEGLKVSSEEPTIYSLISLFDIVIYAITIPEDVNSLKVKLGVMETSGIDGGSSIALYDEATLKEVEYATVEVYTDVNSFSATPWYNYVDLYWDTVFGSTSYEVYRNGIKVYDGTLNSYRDSGLTSNTDYQYDIHVVYRGRSYLVQTLNTTTRSVNLRVNRRTAVSLELLWDDIPDITEFILRKDGEVVYSGKGNSFWVGGLSPNTSYNFTLEIKTENNQLSNGDFELHTGSRGYADTWIRGFSAGSQTIYEVVTSGVRTGNYAQKISAIGIPAGGSVYLVSPNTPIEGGKPFRQQVYVDIQSLVKGTDSRMHIWTDFLGANYATIGTTQRSNYFVTNGFVEMRTEGVTPENARFARTSILLRTGTSGGGGVLIVDDLSLLVDGEEKIINGGFEEYSPTSSTANFWTQKTTGKDNTFISTEVKTGVRGATGKVQKIDTHNIPNGGIVGVNQRIPVPKGSVLNLEGDLYIESLIRSVAVLNVDFYDEVNNIIKTLGVEKSGTTENFEALYSEVLVPEGAYFAEVYFGVKATANAGAGVVYADNLRLSFDNATAESISVETGERKLTIEVPSVVNFSDLTLTGEEENLKADLKNIFIEDTLMDKVSWRLQVTATPFTDNKSGYQLDKGSLLLKPLETYSFLYGTTGIISNTIETDVFIDTGSSVTLLESQPTETERILLLQFPENAMNLSVPPDVRVDKSTGSSNYSSTITWNIITGP